jgi:hypothetical protein
MIVMSPLARNFSMLTYSDRFIIGQRGLKKGIVEYESRGGSKMELSLGNFLEEYERAKEIKS